MSIIKYMKKIITLFLSIQLIMNTLLPIYVSGISGNTPSSILNALNNVAKAGSLYASEGNIISEVCEDKGSKEFFHITDERGTIVLTKKEVNRDCILTKEVQGSCIKWETINEEFVIEADDYDGFRSQNHEGAMGSLLATIGAYDQLEHLWSGWKGYCEVGVKTDFDWASDPMFWAGLAASTIMDASSAGDVSSANAAGDSARSQALGNGSTRASADLAAKNASAAVMSETKGFLADTALGETTRNVQSNISNFVGGSVLAPWVGEAAGKCLMASGFNLGRDLLSYAITSDSDDMCDPVDEFCGDEEEQTEESDIFTIDRVDYNDLIAKDPEIAEFIIILDEDEGIITARYKKTNEMDGVEGMDESQLKELKEKMRQMQLFVSVGITVAKLAACAVSKGRISDTSDANSTATSEGLISVKSGISTLIGVIPAQYLGPYGALVKAALQVALNLAYSFKSIDSCTDEEDAAEQGARHEKTQEALPHDLCYFKYSECVDNCGSGFSIIPELTAFNYCCYDQILTKVIVVQLKAQLGRDWAHCTGITLRDLNFVSFRQCTATEQETGIDGGLEDQPGAAEGEYDPTKTYQYKNKCVDLTEFKDYLKAQIGEDIDMSDFDSIFSDIKGQ